MYTEVCVRLQSKVWWGKCYFRFDVTVSIELTPFDCWTNRKIHQSSVAGDRRLFFFFNVTFCMWKSCQNELQLASLAGARHQAVLVNTSSCPLFFRVFWLLAAYVPESLRVGPLFVLLTCSKNPGGSRFRQHLDEKLIYFLFVFLSYHFSISATDRLLGHLQSFDTNPKNYDVPEYIRSGIPLFVLDPVNPVLNSQLSGK